jgi:hypothetical protein
MGKFIYLLPIFLLFSCTSIKAPVSSTIEKELVAIEMKAPSVQPHVDTIRDELPKIQKLEEEKSSLETWLPWVIVLGSLTYGVWGFSTKNIEDTIGGAIGVAVGIAVATFWHILAWVGLGALILFIVLWSIVSYDWKKSKNKE